jgi:hypothetical protein
MEVWKNMRLGEHGLKSRRTLAHMVLWHEISTPEVVALDHDLFGMVSHPLIIPWQTKRCILLRIHFNLQHSEQISFFSLCVQLTPLNSFSIMIR